MGMTFTHCHEEYRIEAEQTGERVTYVLHGPEGAIFASSEPFTPGVAKHIINALWTAYERGVSCGCKMEPSQEEKLGG